MKKSLLVLIGLINFSGLIHSQFNTINIAEFKLPDIRRNELDVLVATSFRQSASLNKHEYDTTREHSSSFSDLSELRYNYYRNSQKYQGNSYLSFGLHPAWNSIKEDDKSSKGYDLDPFYSLGTSNRFYNPNKYFFEIGFDIAGNHSINKESRTTNSYSGKSKQASLAAEISVAAGYGRLEPVQDARLAVYILEELQKSGKLAVVPDKDEIIEFASFIASLKNERYFDLRLRRMEEIEKVDSFIQSRGWVNKADARYFTTVYDKWEYADGPYRQSGKRLSAGLKPGFSMQTEYTRTVENNVVTNDLSDRDYSTGMEIYVNYIYEKPVNLKWQKGWSIMISYSAEKNQDDNKDKVYKTEFRKDYNDHRIYSSARYTIGYYPNSRTYAKADIFAYAENQRYVKSDDMDLKNYLYIHPGFSLQVQYFISERSGLFFNYNAYFNFQKNEYSSTDYHVRMNDFWQYAHVAFIYKIF